jgi:hypothetical protein
MQKINPLWAAYNQIHNEGAEGYNPHPKHVGSDDGEPLWSKLDDQMYRTLSIMAGTSTDDPRYAKMQATVADLKAAIIIAKKEGI